MQKEWFFLDSDQKAQGPFTVTEILKASDGEDFLVWREGMPDWVRMSSVTVFRKGPGPRPPITHRPGATTPGVGSGDPRRGTITATQPLGSVAPPVDEASHSRTQPIVINGDEAGAFRPRPRILHPAMPGAAGPTAKRKTHIVEASQSAPAPEAPPATPAPSPRPAPSPPFPGPSTPPEPSDPTPPDPDPRGTPPEPHPSPETQPSPPPGSPAPGISRSAPTRPGLSRLVQRAAPPPEPLVPQPEPEPEPEPENIAPPEAPAPSQPAPSPEPSSSDSDDDLPIFREATTVDDSPRPRARATPRTSPIRTVEPTPPASAGSPATPWLQTPSGQRIDITDNFTMGRSRRNVYMILDRNVSREHAVIRFNPQGEILLIDLGSRNGTFVNEERVREQRVLRDGDILRLPGAEFVFHLD